MTHIKQPSAQTVTEAHAAGWIASLILHGALAFGAFAFTQQLKLVPQPTLFQWNVSTVASALPPSNTPTAAAKRSRPSAQAAEPTADLPDAWGVGRSLQRFDSGDYLLAVDGRLYAGTGLRVRPGPTDADRDWTLRRWRFAGLISPEEYQEVRP